MARKYLVNGTVVISLSDLSDSEVKKLCKIACVRNRDDLIDEELYGYQISELIESNILGDDFKKFMESDFLNDISVMIFE